MNTNNTIRTLVAVAITAGIAKYGTSFARHCRTAAGAAIVSKDHGKGDSARETPRLYRYYCKRCGSVSFTPSLKDFKCRKCSGPLCM